MGAREEWRTGTGGSSRTGTAGWRRTMAAAGAVLLTATGAPAQEPPMELPRLTAPVELDGMPDEAAWAAVPPLPLTQYAPVYRGRPSQRTEIRVAYDDEYLYAAGHFRDDEPDGIRINSLYRDRWNGDDAFAIYVDAFNDNENAKWFGTTPGGIRFDQLVSDDGATLNGSWNAFWEARTVVTDEGWFAEVRIPFSTLGFQVVDGRAVMGLTVTRLVSRSGERVTFPDIPPRFAFRQPSRARDVVLTGVTSRRPLYVTPYVLAGRQRERIPREGTFAADHETAREVGVDLHYALSGALTLDVTANTDFAQVEADDQQVALDRFPLFFPEKRRFFQERSGLFEWTTSGGGRLFHSRRIGLTADRQPVPVLGGARLVGRIGEWDVGLLDMHTRRQGDTPAETFAVGRVRRRVLNPFSYVGLLATGRFGGGDHNAALGADALFRLPDDHYLSLKWAGTVDDADPGAADLISRSLFQLRWQRRAQRGPAYAVELMRAGADHRPDLGFLPRRNVTRAAASGNWYLFASEESWFRRVYPGALAFSTFRNGDGSLESGTYAVWVQWDTKAGGGGWLEPKLFYEDVRAPFGIGCREMEDGATGCEVDIPAGRHTFADFQVVYTMPAGDRLRVDVDARSGTFFDGTRTQVIVTPTWNASRHLELGGRYQLTRLRFDERDQAADIHLASLLARTALDARASANAILQYNSTTDRLHLNLRLRYDFAEGTDLWVVWDEGLVTDRTPHAAGPRLPRSMSRGLTVKYTFTFGT